MLFYQKKQGYAKAANMQPLFGVVGGGGSRGVSPVAVTFSACYFLTNTTQLQPQASLTLH